MNSNDLTGFGHSYKQYHSIQKLNLQPLRWHALLAQRRCVGMLACMSLICALILSLTPGSALAFTSNLRRYPYLTDVVGSSATINWATDQSSTTAVVRWGKVGAESCTAHVAPATSTTIIVSRTVEYQWKAMLTLEPDTQYCYRVYLGSAPEIDLLGSDVSPRFWTQIPAGSSKSFSFVVFGDWGMVDDNGNNQDQANLMQKIAASRARFAITTGDNGYPSGSQSNYGDLVQTGPNLSAIFGPSFWTVAGASMPLFPILGNHGLSRSDIYHPHLVNWPQDNAVASSSGRYTMDDYGGASYPSAWYAFDAGNARFYVLDAAWDEANVGSTNEYENDYDAHWTPTSAEYQWLEQDLAAHPDALKFAFFHYPLYSDNSTEPSDTFLQGPNSLEGLLSRNGVVIAFSGHAHIYQRNIKPNANSLVSYITGGGGAKLEPAGSAGCSAVDAYAIGWSYSANGGLGSGSTCGGNSVPVPTSPAQVFHFLLVTVNGTQVTVTPTNSEGKSFDKQTYNFPDTAAPSAPANLAAQLLATGRVALSWTAATDNVGVTGYTLYRNGNKLATVTGQTLTYTDASAKPGNTYSYTVTASDAAGNVSAPSQPAVVTEPSLATPISVFIPFAAQ